MGIGLSEKYVCVGGADNSVLCFEIPEEEEEEEEEERGGLVGRGRGDGKLKLGRRMGGAHWAEVRGVSVWGGEFFFFIHSNETNDASFSSSSSSSSSFFSFPFPGVVFERSFSYLH